MRCDNEMHTPVFPNGSCMCEIEIDPETGSLEIKRYSTIDDVGRCINPLIVHGQTHGGIAQGVGQAMWEGCHIDPATGQPLVGSLMDYGMPRFDNLPSFKNEIAEVLSPTNPFGVKAGGEGGTTGALAVIMSAVEDALMPVCGPVEMEMPATPLKVWTALQAGAAKPSVNIWPRPPKLLLRWLYERHFHARQRHRGFPGSIRQHLARHLPARRAGPQSVPTSAATPRNAAAASCA